MSSSPQEKRTAVREELAREFRRYNGLGASFYRAAAARVGLTVTDLQVIDILDTSGPTTAGQLADLTGLTTGAITGMLNRLEEAGRVRRERDPNDGRRVIVRLAPGRDEAHEIGPLFASLEKAWDALVSPYDDARLTFLLGVLQRSNALTREEIVRLREAPADAGGMISAPLGNLQRGQLVVSSGITRLSLRTDDAMTALYQTRFEGPLPEVKTVDGVVSIRYPRRLWVLSGSPRAAEVTLSVAVPWRIMIQGGSSGIEARLGGLNLAALEVKGGLSTMRLELPVPSGVVPIRISGGASMITIRRPAGVAARVHLKGWASELVFDDRSFSGVGNDVRLQSPGLDPAAPHYAIEVASSASMVTITSA